MRQRGRKSSTSLSVVPVSPRQRPEPPKELTGAQAATWRGVVAALPPEWFDKAAEVLAQYCRHVSAANVIARQIDDFNRADLATDEGLQRLNKLLAMEARESATIAHLATKMRLTQQARYTAQSAATAANRTPAGPKPWDVA